MSAVDFLGTRFEHIGFRGDGNKLVEPSSHELNFIDHHPMKLSKSKCRRIIIRFMESGHSFHRFNMSTAWPVLEYCRIKNIGYKLEYCSIRRTYGG